MSLLCVSICRGMAEVSGGAHGGEALSDALPGRFFLKVLKGFAHCDVVKKKY